MKEIKAMIKDVAGDVIWSGYFAHNTSNKSEVLQDKKISELATHIYKRELEARKQVNEEWEKWAKYPPKDAHFIGVQWTGATHSAVKEVKDHANENISTLNKKLKSLEVEK